MLWVSRCNPPYSWLVRWANGLFFIFFWVGWVPCHMRVRYILGRECGGTSPAVAFVCCVVYRQFGLSIYSLFSKKKMSSWVEFCVVYFSLYGGVQSKSIVFRFFTQAGVSGDSVLFCSNRERCNTAVGPPSHRHVPNPKTPALYR